MKNEEVETMNTILKYPGAKARIADWICSYIPQHDVYLEPFFGSGAVFFCKKPARIETINDLDGNVVNYFRMVREHPEELAQLLLKTPYARDEYKASYIENKNDSDIEKARKFTVQCWMGFGCSNKYRNGFRSSQQKTSPHITKAWKEFPERLSKASIRLTNAQIENLPALELITRYYTKDVFIYIDPPYLYSTRKRYLYFYEMGEEKEHIKLLEILIGHPGKVMISGYDNDLYNKYLAGWKKVQKKTQAEQGLSRIETLWMNYEVGQMELDLIV